jgi:YD repeat-containing protein
LLENGWYLVRLEALDWSGNGAAVEVPIEVQGEAKIGIVRLSFVDLEIPLSGIPVSVGRTYDSRVKTQRDFGVGWTLDVRAGTFRHNRTPGLGWSIHENFPPPSFPCSVTDELSSHYTTVRLGDREWYSFRPILVNVSSSFGSCFADVAYELIDGYVPGATLEILSNASVIHLSGTTEINDEITGLPWEPEELLLTTPDGREITLERGAGVTRIADLDGNSIDISASGVVHSSGRSVSFVRDGAGRITEIEDPLGSSILYHYDEAGDLVGVENQLGETTRFEYSSDLPHHLVRVVKPDGTTAGAFGFDAEGRLDQVCPASPPCSALAYDLEARQQAVADPTGVVVLVEHDARGNVVATTNTLGHRTSYEFDAANNMTARVDPLGNRTEYTFDSQRNVLSETRPYPAGANPEHYTRRYSYDSRGRLTSVELPTGASFTLERSATGHLTAMRDDEGNAILSLGYNARGDLIRETDLSGTSTYTVDYQGLRTARIDPDGHTFTMTYDAAGTLRTMEGSDGEDWTFTPDALGRDSRADYGDGLIVDYGYQTGPAWTTIEAPTLGRIERRFSPSGRLAGWALPDGVELDFSHDPAGRLIEESDPSGTTGYTHDAAGRPESVTVAGAQTTWVRDAAGRVIEETDAIGAVRTSSYAPDGSLIAQTDPLGNTWHFTRTPTVSEVTDPLGRTHRTFHNAYGLPIEWEDADGSRRSATYHGNTTLDESEDRPLSLTDEAGRVRSFTYSARGALATATDLAGEAWIYSHGRDGLLSITTPLGDETTIQYDAQGRQFEVVASDGSFRRTEYDPSGHPSVLEKASGQRVYYGYAPGNRLTSVQASGDAPVFYGWNEARQMSSVSDGTGVTTFSFDGASRPSQVDASFGGRVRYERDVLGRITVIAVRPNPSASEQVTTYSYDLAGRLTGIEDPLGGDTVLEYDGAGRLVSRTLPNGITTTVEYDLGDRPVLVEHRRSNGSVIASVEYERAVTGEPARIWREDGSSVELGYDAALRLTSETYRSTAGAILEQNAYAYL